MLSFQTQTGLTYTIRYKNALSDPVWQTLCRRLMVMETRTRSTSRQARYRGFTAWACS